MGNSFKKVSSLEENFQFFIYSTDKENLKGIKFRSKANLIRKVYFWLIFSLNRNFYTKGIRMASQIYIYNATNKFNAPT